VKDAGSTGCRNRDTEAAAFLGDLGEGLPLTETVTNLRAGIAAQAAGTIAVIAAVTLGGALVFEHGFGIKPCPMCLEQRYAYHLAIVLGAALALGAKALPRAMLFAGLAILAVATLVNAGYGAFHAGVEWGFWPGPATCSGSAVDLGSAGSLLERLETVKVIRCDEVQWRFLGLSLAGYNVLISNLMALIALWGIARMRSAPSA
jgi:disulfide bond formation protein DsbB